MSALPEENPGVPEGGPAANKGIWRLVLFMLGILATAILVGRLLQ